MLHVVPAGTRPAHGGAVVDAEDVYLPYLAEADVLGILVRPDFYVFGGFRDAAEANALVHDLRRRLAPRRPPADPAALTRPR
ncbi:hypothetical protein JOL79_16575 [Microbispora sp. RL4-1S]|uniref:Uncharacterized protein n=1 Tax=Microbispora oryzae TaxID=2806554 RepID=A0A940WR33_9ACTN|nr:hypothetical protein [Microbispora oryzae]MBP2705429.1 hypothetical protein [Microbispora oryzae]